MSGVRDAVLSAGGGLPVGACESCGRAVVAYARVAPADAGVARPAALTPDREAVDELWACVHCDGRLAGVEWVDEASLEHLGYELRDPLAAACGTGCGAGGGCLRHAGAHARPSWRSPS